jgi:hypothetical protein
LFLPVTVLIPVVSARHPCIESDVPI